VLLAPSGTSHPFYGRVRLGWQRPATNAKVPNAETVWRQDGSGPLAVDRPLTPRL